MSLSKPAPANGVNLQKFFIVKLLTLGKTFYDVGEFGYEIEIKRSRYESEFPLEWMQKVLPIIAIASYETKVALPLAIATKESERAIGRGLGQQAFSSIYNF